MMRTLHLHPSELEKGDRVFAGNGNLAYTVIADALRDHFGNWRVTVEFRDGSTGVRVWDLLDTTTTIAVLRDG